MHRSKLTRLADGVVMASPSPRVRVIWDNSHGPEHVIAYLGFSTKAAADTCFNWLAANALVGAYDRKANAGANKPRKASRVDGCAWEIKIHSIHAGILAQAIEKDLARAKVAA